MGDAVGVHSDAELAGLNAEQREQVKQEVLQQLQNNQDIRTLINNNPRPLTRTPEINAILKRELRATIDRLRGNQ
jgi:hypothetical protein